jgi:TP901 family phage tail tape measure protein
MVALGAATASSSEEISEGLNKFAAVAETVGLSYEYAASALATVTAETRQSADVVGTAFKTLFARIQDLELGKTLDDGTTLGKYSQALAAVGINIKQANGDVKDMNTILDEMGSKWDSLSKAS